MTKHGADLRDISSVFLRAQREHLRAYVELPTALDTSPSTDLQSDMMAESIFLRSFKAWESAIEKMFLHFCEGGSSLGGMLPRKRLINCTKEDARKILKYNSRYLDWSDQSKIRDRAELFFVDPDFFRLPLISVATELNDSETIRNSIAHDSAEAWNSYQRMLDRYFTTQRLFRMGPGQLLRIRRKGGESWGTYLIGSMILSYLGIAKKV